MNRGSEKRKLLIKIVGAAVLAVVFASVLSSVPDNKLAWQGPLVMGTLLLPKPNPAYVAPRDLRPNSDSMFSLLSFLSVMGILVLGWRWFFTKPSPRKVVDKVVHPLVFP
jgi:hypothetical protein